MKYAIYLFAFAFIFTVAACGSDDDASSCNTDDVTYTNTIEGIIADAGCAVSGCHPAALSAAGFSLATYDDVTNFARLDQMVSALRWEDGFQQMPRDSVTLMGSVMLPDCDVDKIEAWIAAGTPQ